MRPVIGRASVTCILTHIGTFEALTVDGLGHCSTQVAKANGLTVSNHPRHQAGSPKSVSGKACAQAWAEAQAH